MGASVSAFSGTAVSDAGDGIGEGTALSGVGVVSGTSGVGMGVIVGMIDGTGDGVVVGKTVFSGEIFSAGGETAGGVEMGLAAIVGSGGASCSGSPFFFPEFQKNKAKRMATTRAAMPAP